MLWERRYNGPRNYSDSASDVAVDREDNVIVTGSSTGSGGNNDLDSALDIYTAKYSGATGAVIWEKLYNGPYDGVDDARDVAVDGEGNAVVFGVSATGVSASGSGIYDFYTAKYAAATGALLWESRQSEPSIGFEYSSLSQRLALTPDGGAVFTATSGVRDPVLGTYPFDYFTVNYAPVDLDGDNDGLLDSWEVTHFGSKDGQSALDDTDGDGAVELLELAFGTDPRAANSVPAPAVVIEGGYLTTTITKQPCVRYVVQTGAAPEAGFSAANTTVLTDSTTSLKVRDNVPVGTQPARFLRVQVTAQP